MAVFRSDLERSWARTVLMLGLLIALFALMRHASWPALDFAQAPAESEPQPALVSVPVPAIPSVAVAPPQSPQRLLFPLAGYEHALRDNFHEKRGVRTHNALDIMAPRGTPVLAVDDGRIAKFYRGPMAGIAVYQFDRETRRVYFYAHLDRRAEGLVEGQPVARGDLIGYVGSTGNAPETAPHLHFSVHALGPDKRWWKGEAVNPYPLLRNPG
jgi:murein DD-endopeptidase MepM/ murein hydrolase activator NlpD